MTVDQKTVAWLEARGYLVGKVERQTGKIKRDLFGFGDFVALKGDDTILVQATSASNFASRVHKINDAELLSKVLETWHVWALGFYPDDRTPKLAFWTKRGAETLPDCVIAASTSSHPAAVGGQQSSS